MRSGPIFPLAAPSGPVPPAFPPLPPASGWLRASLAGLTRLSVGFGSGARSAVSWERVRPCGASSSRRQSVPCASAALLEFSDSTPPCFKLSRLFWARGLLATFRGHGVVRRPHRRVVRRDHVRLGFATARSTRLVLLNYSSRVCFPSAVADASP